MTKKIHHEKQANKRQFVGKDQINRKEKMASLQPEVKPAIPDSTNQANQTPVASVSTAPQVLAQRTFQFARKKTAWEKLKDKLQQWFPHFN